MHGPAYEKLFKEHPYVQHARTNRAIPSKALTFDFLRTSSLEIASHILHLSSLSTVIRWNCMLQTRGNGQRYSY